jgi:hypothetical protein
MPEKSDEETPLLEGPKRPWLEQFEDEPVGGHPGNSAFRSHLMLALRCSFFACILASAIWIPGLDEFIPQVYAQYIPLSVMMIFFTINPVFGGIVGASTAAIIGTFFAVANIFILRGFFPDGSQRDHAMGIYNPAAVVGWLDVMIFNFIFIASDVRPGTKLFAMGHNTGYMLAFLNPDDKSIAWSKNFQINHTGTAVSCLKVTIFACIMTMFANLLPVPFKFAYHDMKENGKRVSAYVAKNIISSVDYYKGKKKSVLIEKQMMSTLKVEKEIATMGASIDGAYYEGFDLGYAGTVRKQHATHKATMGEILDITKAMEIALKTEDFAESHTKLMNAIGDASSQLADSTGMLLMSASDGAQDGSLDNDEQKRLLELEDQVNKDIKTLAKDFDTVRRDTFTPIHKEVLNESFFVFALSAYGRKVVEYSKMLRENPPEGDSFFPMVGRALKQTFNLENVQTNHTAVATRCWLAVMIAFVYGVTLDHYTGACAVTIVFLQSSRVAPDILQTLQVLTAVAISSCVSAIIYARSCQTGQTTSLFVLPFMAFLYWWFMLYIAFSGSTFSLIGLLSSALSPFVLVVRCPAPDEVSGSTAALPLWISIRGFMIALVIMSVAEYFSGKDTLSILAYEPLDKAMFLLQKAFKCAWRERDPSEYIAPIPDLLTSSKTYSKAAEQEPRFWRCKWKSDVLMETADMVEFLRLHILTMRHAMVGAEGHGGKVFDILCQVQAFTLMQKDFLDTYEDAHELTMLTLKHEAGEFHGLEKLVTLENIDTLDGWEDAIQHVNDLDGFGFPKEEIETMENDLLCQMSIVFVMLDFSIQHVASILRTNVRKS